MSFVGVEGSTHRKKKRNLQPSQTVSEETSNLNINDLSSLKNKNEATNDVRKTSHRSQIYLSDGCSLKLIGRVLL